MASSAKKNQQETDDDFQRIVFPRSLGEQKEASVEHTSAEFVEMAKLALSREELNIAEKLCSQAVRKQILENRSTGESCQPYFYLGGVLEKKAVKSNGNSLEKQRLLLQAAALYNFVNNCFKAGRADTDCSIEKMKEVSQKLLDIQRNLVLSAEGDPLRCHFDSELDKRELEELRNEAKEYLQSLKEKESLRDSQETEKPEGPNKFIERASQIRELCERISSRVKQFLSRVINQCVQVLGDPPCDYQVVVLGSLARDEMTPYSDLEWAILISSEEEKCKVFFRSLTNLVHLQIINLGETILPIMGIKALNCGWFYDNITPRGISFDAFLPQACKTPLGNMKDFELIHCPAEMAEFQSDSWYQKNPSLGDILLTVAPLESNGEIKLIEQYRTQLGKYLRSPCDSKNCHICTSNQLENPPCRGVCRGMAGLRKDFSRYEKMLPSIDKMSEDGKLYDVKKEIYRLVDRVYAGLASCFEIRANGAFKILDELEMNGIITSAGRENLASAAAIALELRIKTYLEAGKQGEQLIANAIDKDEAIVSNFESFYRLLNEEELFHFFFVASPLYKAIRQCCVLDGQIPNSLAEQAFFDCSPAVKGHIYRRILKYEQAFECYESALETNPDDTDMRLCRIDIQLELDRSAEMAFCIEKQLEALIRSLCKKHNLPEGNVDQNGHFIPMISGCSSSLQNETESRWELLKILDYLSGFHLGQGNVELAQHIYDQRATLSPIVDQSGDSTTYFSLMQMTPQLKPEQSEEIVAYLGTVIEEEGISIQSIELLNEFGGFLMDQEKFQQAYQCLQRALAMERTLFISNFNLQTKETLTKLGIITVKLGMYQEGKIYYNELRQLRKSLNITSDKKSIANQLNMACLCLHTSHYEEGISHSQDILALLKSDSFKRESYLECITHSLLTSFWHKLNETDKALKSTMDAQACLSKITDKNINVPLTCALAENFHTIGRHEDAVLLVKRSLEEADSELEMSHKAEYLKTLGELYVQQGLALQAEHYYKMALDCLMVDNKNTCAIVECLLELCGIMFEKDDSSEVKSLLEEAWKYASTLPEGERLYYYIRWIGMFWVKLGDFNHAFVWYGDVLAEYKNSSAQVNVPLFECELHINVGDMTELCFRSIDSDISLSSEKRHDSRRLHYDRAARVLHHQTSLGNVKPMTAVLFVHLASRYRSFDLAEEEKLLFEALEICRTIDEIDGICEIEAAALTGLSDTKWLSGDYLSSFDFLERSLRIEMELNSSATNYSHIPVLLFRLTRFHLNGTDNKLLGDITQRVLEFVDMVETQAFPKKNAAMCLWSANVLYSSMKEYGKAYSALERASRLFDAVGEDRIANNKLQVREYRERLFTVYPYAIDIEDLLSTVLAPLAYPGANGPLIEAFLSEITADHERETSSNKAEQIPSNINTAFRYFDTSIFYAWKGNDKTESKDTATNDKKQSKRIQSFEKRIDRLHLLAENVNCDLKIGNILQASRTIRSTLKPFIVSLFRKNCPENIDPGDYLFNEALKAKKSHGTMMMLVYLHLADLFPSPPQLKGKISELRGECNLSERNYRTAALCFADAAGFFAEAETVDPCENTGHLVVLTELARSHMLCSDYKAAWKTCQEGLRLFGTSVSRDVKFLLLQTKLFLLAARCLISLATADHQLQEAVSICARGLACSKLIDCSTQPDQVWEIVKLKYKLERCLAAALSRLDKVEESQKTVGESVEFLKIMYIVLDEGADINDTDRDTDNLKISCCLYSWIGQAELMSGDNNVALTWLTKSLSAFLALGIPDTVSMEQEFLELLDAITAAKENVTKANVTAFKETIELFMQILLEEPDGLNMLPRFFEAVAQLYVDRGREEAAAMLYEKALTVVECTGNFSDMKKVREVITFLLAQCHRRQSIKETKKGAVEETRLAEKFCRMSLENTENFVLSISYAGFLYDQGCFEEAREVLERVISENDELWDIQITCSYSSRILWSSAIKRYIEDHGECVTTAGILAYNLLVHICVAFGRKKEAVKACRKLSEKGEEVEMFANRPSFMQYVLSACQKALATLVDDQGCLGLKNTTFPLSDSDLEKLYSKLDEWTPALVRRGKTSDGRLSGELSEEVHESRPQITDLLQMLQVQEGIFDKPFVAQKAILEQLPLGNEVYEVYESLGMLLSARGGMDGAIECYEYCLSMNEDYSHGQDLIATVAELYQVKAMTALNDDKVSYARWMSAAEECFNKLRLKTEKVESFVASAFGSFLCRQGRFEEAISQFQNSLDEKCETKIALTSVDKSLISVYLQREIEARGELILPLEILVYHEMVPAFLKLNKVDNAQQSLQQMEKQVKLFRSAPEYALILSVLGYTHKDVGNMKKAKDIFLSVLQINPGHTPVTDALETCH